MKNYEQYYVAYEKDPKRGYIASAPAIPGCVVYGKTLKEAHQNITVAIRECLEVREEFKKQLPRETISSAQVQRFPFSIRDHCSDSAQTSPRCSYWPFA